MTIDKSGKFSAKYPPGTKPDPLIAAAVEEVIEDRQLSCAVAHDLAEELSVSPAAVGKTLDLLDDRIVKCQMGLFGYGPDKKLLKPASSVSEELRDRIAKASPKGRISCASCWRIAQVTGLQKIEVAAACEALGLKIKPCQLGAF